MNFLKLLTIGARRGSIATVPDLVTALSESAAYLAQGAAYAYLRARSGTMGPRLMQDPGFGAAAERCKWEAFAAVAADLVLIVEGEIRLAGILVPGATLETLYARVLAAHEMPGHRAAAGWSDCEQAFARRLEKHEAQEEELLAHVGEGPVVALTPTA